MKTTRDLGRTVRITVRLTPEDAELLARIAWDQHRTQTDVFESLVRTLTLPPPPTPTRYEALIMEQQATQALIRESTRLLTRIAAACERLAGEGSR
jgi:hypothetical protein